MRMRFLLSQLQVVSINSTYAVNEFIYLPKRFRWVFNLYYVVKHANVKYVYMMFCPGYELNAGKKMECGREYGQRTYISFLRFKLCVANYVQRTAYCRNLIQDTSLELTGPKCIDLLLLKREGIVGPLPICPRQRYRVTHAAMHQHLHTRDK